MVAIKTNGVAEFEFKVRNRYTIASDEPGAFLNMLYAKQTTNEKGEPCYHFIRRERNDIRELKVTHKGVRLLEGSCVVVGRGELTNFLYPAALSPGKLKELAEYVEMLGESGERT